MRHKCQPRLDLIPLYYLRRGPMQADVFQLRDAAHPERARGYEVAFFGEPHEQMACHGLTQLRGLGALARAAEDLIRAHRAGAELQVRPRFSLGELTVQRDADAALIAAGMQFQELLHRHISGDWGDVTPQRAASNEAALQRTGEPMISIYSLPGSTSRICVTTDPHRWSTSLSVWAVGD